MLESNYEIAKKRADEIDNLIIDTVESGKSFRIEAGAGAGKTYSLMKVISWLETEKGKEFRKKGQKVACITYTNAAVDVITNRLASDSFINPSTIHKFAWDSMKRFQSMLIKGLGELNLLPDNEEKIGKVAVEDIRYVAYDLGGRRFFERTAYLHHNDVIDLFSWMLDMPKFRMILAEKYPIILIDEYQDSFSRIMDKLLKYYVNEKIDDVNLQIGLFGDAWQTIYANNKVCGEVNNENLVVIGKPSNFRSEEIIVNALNRIRPELPQIPASDENDGEIRIITTDNYRGERQTGSHWKGDLPLNVLESYVDSVRAKLRDLGWKDNKTKVLMLTHRLLSHQQHYDNLFEFLGDRIKDADDEHFCFFMDRAEPVFESLQKNDIKGLFEALGGSRRPIRSIEEKKEWKEFKEKLEIVRKGQIKDVIDLLYENTLLPLPPKVHEKRNSYEHCENGKKITLHGKDIEQFYNISYQEVVNAIAFVKPDAFFSTEHGVKGEEYDNVLFVLGRGWNQYKFDETIYLDPKSLKGKEIDTYERNRNLFYVCCSRPKKRLAILVTVKTNSDFINYLEYVFGRNSIVSYEEFLNL